MKELLGGKGANLCEMTTLGIAVPFGFTVTTQVCDEYYKNDRNYPEALKGQIEENLAKVEKEMGMKFGDPSNPLLFSVRSGAAVSMPGMMDTVLNLGLNDETVAGLIKKTNNPRFGWDSYRRFIQMFGDVVMNVPHHNFEHILEEMKKAKGAAQDTDLTADDLKELVGQYRDMVKKEAGKDFPASPMEQLMMSITAVFDSWNNDRAIAYRRINDIRGLIGTAVNVQAMVFGNMGDTSGTGVCFTRDPSTGENYYYGEYLMNAQGEDVVAGIRTPNPMSDLEKANPEIYKQLCDYRDTLEKHYKDMQDMEFTIQEGKLYMLQTRNGKRTAKAAVRTAIEMVEEGLIDKKTAVLRVDPNSLDQLLHPTLEPKAQADAKAIAKGLPASPGAAVGKAVFTAQKAHDEAAKGEKVILIRTETSPEDIEGMHAAVGILTSRGGMTSHAAVVARGMGTCCVAGCGDLNIREDDGYFTCGDLTIKEGEWVTLDGTSGEVYAAQLPVVEAELSGEFGKLMEWADEYRTMGVRTNADSPHDSEVARKFGAEGIGLCRTEHMFFEGDRIKAVREMILSGSLEGRQKALAKLLPYQREDFEGIFKAMHDLPVTVRLLDPPLHEFLPQEEKDIRELATELNVSFDELNDTIESLHELNPMLGHRGCRLSITYPEICEMQTEAIIAAACAVKKAGVNCMPEIMVPLVGVDVELAMLKEVIVNKAKEVMEREGIEVDYKVGTMIEVPRGALTADKVAEHAEFFSFGTNDLTQMAFGFSRDDINKFLPEYIEKGIFEKDPFAVLDQKGVGQLVQCAVEKGRKTRPNIKLGICGEHGGIGSFLGTWATRKFERGKGFRNFRRKFVESRLFKAIKKMEIYLSGQIDNEEAKRLAYARSQDFYKLEGKGDKYNQMYLVDEFDNVELYKQGEFIQMKVEENHGEKFDMEAHIRYTLIDLQGDQGSWDMLTNHIYNIGNIQENSGFAVHFVTDDDKVFVENGILISDKKDSNFRVLTNGAIMTPRDDEPEKWGVRGLNVNTDIFLRNSQKRFTWNWDLNVFMSVDKVADANNTLKPLLVVLENDNEELTKGMTVESKLREMLEKSKADGIKKIDKIGEQNENDFFMLMQEKGVQKETVERLVMMERSEWKNVLTGKVERGAESRIESILKTISKMDKAEQIKTLKEELNKPETNTVWDEAAMLINPIQFVAEFAK
jgi:pyruvate,orthophosphate dikinase